MRSAASVCCAESTARENGGSGKKRYTKGKLPTNLQ